MTSVPLTLSILYSNIQEIYGAVCRDDVEPLQLSSTDGIQLNQKDSIPQILKNFIWMDRVAEALAYTAKLFEEIQTSWLTEQIQTYETYLKALKEGSVKELEEPHGARNHIVSWYDNTGAFLELRIKETVPEKLNALVNLYFSGNDPFAHANNVKTARYAAIVRMETCCRLKLPLHDWLSMVRRGENLPKKTNHKKWVDEYLKTASVNPYGFYQGIQAVMDFFKSLETNTEPYNSAAVVYALWTDGKAIFIKQPDWEHLEWRKKLQIGDRLGAFNITGRFFDSGKTPGISVFRLDDPRYVAKVFSNRSIAFLYDFSSKQIPQEIPLPQTIQIDPEGRFIIQERCDDPAAGLDRINVTQIGNREKEALSAAVRIMEYFIANGWCPTISLGYFRVTSSNQLCSLRPYIKTSHWLEPYEDYARELSQNNQIVYRYLMESVKVQETENYRLYRDVVEGFAEGREDYFSRKVVIYHVGEDHYGEWMERMKALYRSVQKIRERVKRNYYEAREKPLSDADLKRTIVSYYKESNCISSLFNDAETEIAKRALLK